MATAALRLRRLYLLADPTRFLSTRIEPQIHRIRSTAATGAAASPPLPRPTHCGSSIQSRRPPSPSCPPSAASVGDNRSPSPRPTTSAASIDSHCIPSPPAVNFAPSFVSPHCSSPPRIASPGFSIVDYPHSDGEPYHQLGLQAAVEAGHQALPKGRKSESQSMRIQAARRILSAANSQLSPARRLLGSGEKRLFSGHGSPEVNQSRLPAVSQLAFRDDSQVLGEEWVDPIPFLKEHSLVVDSRTNHLNLEIPGFEDQPRFNFSEDIGIPLFRCLVSLALINNNRGYCIKNSFRKDNVLLCSRLKQFRFKKLDYDDLDVNSREFNCAASYLAAATLMRELLADTVGPDTVSYLLEEPRDLFNKLERPSDVRLIIYHTSFLSTDGRIWMYKKLYWFFFKLVRFSKDKDLQKKADKAICEMAYTSREERSVVDIIMSHPLLAKIDSNKDKHNKNSEKEANLEANLEVNISGQCVGESYGPTAEKMKLGKRIVALPRHTIEHAFDDESRKVLSKIKSVERPGTLWWYSLDQVVDMLRSIIPVHLLKAQETFLKEGLWTHLEMDKFWPQDLSWMGGVPEPTKEEKAAMKPSYGKRRQQSRKFDRFDRGTIDAGQSDTGHE